MTQPQQKDERLLGYLYGELDAEERAQVEAELAHNAALRAELESYRRVRGAWKTLPPVTQSADSVQRMTALLMQQATQSAGAGAAQTQPGAETATGGGKMLAFRARGVRRVLTNPATGIFAAAAAALFWVVFKSSMPTPRTDVVASVATTQHAAEPVAQMVSTAPAPTTAAEGRDAVEANKKLADVAAPPEAPTARPAPAEKKADPQQWAQLSRSAAASDLEAKPAPPAPTHDPFAAKPSEGATSSSAPSDVRLELSGKAVAVRSMPSKAKASLDGKLMATNDSPPGGRAATGAVRDDGFAADRKREEAPATKDTAPAAQPPPPAPAAPAAEAEGGVRAAIAQTQARRNQRVIEELANQELGSMPAPAGGVARPSLATSAATPSPQTEGDRYAQNDGVEQQTADEAKGNGRSALSNRGRESAYGGYGQAPVANQAGPSRSASNVNSNSDQDSLPLLAAVQDYLRQGRCAEANTSLTRIEQSFPATRGLPEARAQWQRSCGPAGNVQPVPQERPMLAQPAEATPPRAPAAAPSQMMNRDAMRMKKAAPARKPPASNVKAADVPAL